MESGTVLAAFMVLGAVIVLGLLLSGYTGDPSNPSSLASITRAPMNSTTNASNATFNATPALESPLPSVSDLTLDIRIPKLVYSVGENFTGEYYVRYNGTPFYGIVLYCMSYPPSSGFNSTCRMARGMISDVDFDNPRKRNNLGVLMQAEYYRNGNSYFLDNGIYTYSISVYECASVDMQLNTSGCGGALADESSDKLLDLQRFGPLTARSITVIGHRKAECSTNLECASCSGCVTGWQACLNDDLGASCVDCFMDSMCAVGHRCQQNKCIFQN
jgi:hypothetical protein